jgi:predicted small secreted protein
MKRMNTITAWVGAASLALLTAACDNTARGMRQDAQENQQEAAQAADAAKARANSAADEAKARADRAAEEAKADADRAAARADSAADRAQERAGNAAERAGDRVEGTAGRVGAQTDAAMQTMQVKSALIADNRVDASHIDVDTDAASKTVVLKGQVPTATQKSFAAGIARDKAEGYTIKNVLTIAK